MNLDFYGEDEIGIDLDNFDMEAELKIFDDYTPKPVDILIRLFIPPKKTKSGLIVPNDKHIYQEIVGYVAKIGKCAFTGERYKEWGEWYKVRDFVIFPRHAGMRFTYGGLPVFAITDDAVYAITTNPRKVR